MKKMFITFFFIAAMFAQSGLKTNSFYDDRQVKEFSIDKIIVDGEVENPGEINLSSLPLKDAIIKDVYRDENGKLKFRGSYHYTGWSLFDIIDSKLVKKNNTKDFSPNVDLFIVIENAAGKKVVVSWGEIYYSKNPHKVLLTKSVSSISPSKDNKDWELPENPRFVFSDDLIGSRTIENPVKVTIKTPEKTFPKLEDVFASEIKVLLNGKELPSINVLNLTEKRTFKNVGYGHGRGYKGINTVEAFVLREELTNRLKDENYTPENSFVIISSKDSYRAVYSLSELINRNDNNEFLLEDRSESQSDGKYTVFAAPDFFVDRNVRAVDKIEIFTVK